MTEPTLIRAAIADGVTTVRMRMTHSMETGARRAADGALVPAHFISLVEVSHNGRTLLTAHWSPAVSQNPLLTFRFRGASQGERITVRWVDNRGATRSDSAVIA